MRPRPGVRGWMTAMALGMLAGCAHVEPPPGGPEDQAPPQLVATRPDSLATVAGFRDAVVLAFDERISEQGIEDAVLVSPRTSPVQVDQGGDEIRVSLREGWETGRIYQITLLPGVQDLFNNRRTEPVQLVFSTGPAIPDTRLGGTAVDRITGEAQPELRVEAIRTADSLVYATRSDSTGRFVFTRIPEGRYRVRAFTDVNRNRILDPFEARDTATANVAASAAPSLELQTLLPDTTPPVLASARRTEDGVELTFDDYLDPAQAITPAQLQVIGPGGAPVPVRRAYVGTAPVAAAPADTIAPPPADTVRAPAAEPTAVPAARPARTLVVELAAPLPTAGETRVRAQGVRNLSGLVGGGETVVEASPPPQR